MFRLEDLTHVIIVAGDSDYVPLAQRCKRLGRYVVGVGVAGSTAKSLAAACDEFTSYDSLPGVQPPRQRGEDDKPRRGRGSSKRGGAGRSEEQAAEAPTRGEAETEAGTSGAASGEDTGAKTSEPGRSGSRRAQANKQDQQSQPAQSDSKAGSAAHTSPLEDHDDDTLDSEFESEEERDIAVTGLLIRALWLSQDTDDSGWLYSSAVKQQMRRMDPSFNEKALGFRSFSDFLRSRSDVVELEESGHERLVRLADQSS
jgi:hypothetical protein